jgi:hypothetical protein
MRALAIPETAMSVMDFFWSINTHTHNNAIALKAFTPGVVNQRGIGLDMLLNLNPLLLQLCCLLAHNGTGLVVKAARQCQRFACMPKN